MTLVNWKKPDTNAFILDSNIHIWHFEFSAFKDDLDLYEKVLSNDEIKRADKFYFKIDRKRYIVTRSILRIIISKINRVPPQEIIFKFNEYGKPQLSAPVSGIYFNSSHSGNKGMTAITDIAEVGIDVEQHRKNMATEKIAKRFFSSKEVEEFTALQNNSKQTGFFNGWTRKEAFIKALGLGLAMPLKNFDVSLTPQKKVQIYGIRRINEIPENWTLLDIPIQSTYSAALAIKSQMYTVYYWMADKEIYNAV